MYKIIARVDYGANKLTRVKFPPQFSSVSPSSGFLLRSQRPNLFRWECDRLIADFRFLLPCNTAQFL